MALMFLLPSFGKGPLLVSLIGELSGGGDPPVFGTELTTARLRKKGVELQNRSVYGEEGDNGKTTLEIDSSSQFRKIKNYEFQE